MIEHTLCLGGMKSSRFSFAVTPAGKLYECRILDANGKIKKVISPEKIIEEKRKTAQKSLDRFRRRA